VAWYPPISRFDIKIICGFIDTGSAGNFLTSRKGWKMKPFFAALLCSYTISLQAQKTVDVAEGNVSAMSPSFFSVVGGEPVVFAKFAKIVDGTPYFSDEWIKGNVVINGEKQFTGVFLKLDLYYNEVHYRDPRGNELVAVTPIQKLILFDSLSQLVYTFINGKYINANSRITGWYQLLIEGKASVFKQIKKQMNENKPYGSATIERSVYTSFQYYALSDGNFVQVKKFKDLPDVLSDKKEEVSKYIKTNNLSGKSDDDYRVVFNYYNGLK